MSSIIPKSFTYIDPEEAASGERDRARMTRDVSFNSNYIYGNKLLKMQHVTGIWQTTGTLAATYMDSGSMGINVQGANVAVERQLGSFIVPPSLSNTQDINFLVAFDNSLDTMATLNLKVDSSTDSSDNITTTQSLAISSTTPSTMGKVPAGSKVYMSIKGNGTSKAEPGQLKSVCVFYSEGKYSERYRRFSPTKATFSAPNVPDCSVVYRRLIDSHANLINEPTIIMNRYYGLPWTNRLTTWTTVGEYLFYTDPLTTNVLAHVYARRGGATAGDFRVVLNDTVKFTETGIGTSWTLFGGYLMAPSAGVINKLQIQARMTTGDGTGLGVQVAGVYCWEETRSAVAATGDSVSTSFVGNDTDALKLGRLKIYADEATRITTSNRHAGKQQLNKDAVWLKSNRREMYVNDWRHRCHSGDSVRASGGVFANMISGSNYNDYGSGGSSGDGYDDLPVNGANGSVLARHLFPATSGSVSGVDVYVDVMTPIHAAVPDNEAVGWDIRVKSTSVDGDITTNANNDDILPNRSVPNGAGTISIFREYGLAEYVNGFKGSGYAVVDVDPNTNGIRVGPIPVVLDTDKKTEVVVEGQRSGAPYYTRYIDNGTFQDLHHNQSMDRLICTGVTIREKINIDEIP